MKLNNKGWGTSTMILLSLGLLIALLIAVFFISSLYGSFSNSIGNKYYLDLETRLENAAGIYIVNNNIEVVNDYRIDLKTLQDSGLIGEFKDKLGNNCDGYVIVTKPDIANVFDSRISCSDYQTRNY